MLPDAVLCIKVAACVLATFCGATTCFVMWWHSTPRVPEMTTLEKFHQMQANREADYEARRRNAEVMDEYRREAVRHYGEVYSQEHIRGLRGQAPFSPVAPELPVDKTPEPVYDGEGRKFRA